MWTSDKQTIEPLNSFPLAYVLGGTYIFIWVCAHVCTSVWSVCHAYGGPEMHVPTSFLITLQLTSWDRVFCWTWDHLSVWLGRLIGQWGPGIHLLQPTPISPVPTPETMLVYRSMLPTPSFYVCTADPDLRKFSCLHGKCFTNWAIAPAVTVESYDLHGCCLSIQFDYINRRSYCKACLRATSLLCEQMPGRSNLMEEGFLWAHVWKSSVHYSEKSVVEFTDTRMYKERRDQEVEVSGPSEFSLPRSPTFTSQCHSLPPNNFIPIYVLLTQCLPNLYPLIPFVLCRSFRPSVQCTAKHHVDRQYSGCAAQRQKMSEWRQDVSIPKTLKIDVVNCLKYAKTLFWYVIVYFTPLDFINPRIYSQWLFL